MKYGLIGEKLGHSYSKIIQEKLLADYTYELTPLSKQAFTAFMEAKQFKGINVTIPYKQAVLPYLDVCDQKATQINAVNTIVNKEGKLIGYNTDYDGFLYTLQKHQITIKGKKVLVLGNGGAAQAILSVLHDLEAKEIIITARTLKPGVVSLAQVYKHHLDIEVIINTTPVGMYPHIDETPIDITCFLQCEACVDIIYNPLQTKLLLAAKKMNMQAVNGLEMLVAQAKYALEYFKEIKFDESEINRIYLELKKERENLVFIGMPGCGKTTIAKKVAKLLNKQFVDIDKLIEEEIKMNIADYFAIHGEDKFRIIEKQITTQLCVQTGLVISCGGGIVKDTENITHLKQNGILFLLERELADLVSGPSRPLSATKEDVEKLYKERKHLYEEAYDIKVHNNASVSDVAQMVIHALHSYKQ